jgi:cytochrome c
MKAASLLTALLLATSFATALPAAASSFDEKAAKATMKSNDCGKCHAEKKTKKGPSYKKIAEKYLGKADAEPKIMKHLREEPMVKLDDGTEEKHKAIKVKDEAELKNLVQYILAQ